MQLKNLESASPPWGKWEVLLEMQGYKVKQITVNPGQKLSYQKHDKRREHWVAVKGEALVTLDGQDFTLRPGETIDILPGLAHRAANPGKEPLIFVEVQLGSYLGEDDIVRLDDEYGRV